MRTEEKIRPDVERLAKAKGEVAELEAEIEKIRNIGNRS
jgi:hypothetical protein